MYSKSIYALFVSSLIVTAATEPTQAEPTRAQREFAQKNEVHLIVGDCAAAGMKPFLLNGQSVVASYVRSADASNPPGKQGGADQIAPTNLPRVSGQVADVYQVHMNDIGPLDGAADAGWLIRGGNHPDRGNATTLSAATGQDKPDPFLPRYLAVSFCSIK